MEPSPLALELAALLLARARPLAELDGAAAAASATPGLEFAPPLRRVSHDLAAAPPPATLVATEAAVTPAQAEAATLASLARGGGAGSGSHPPSPLHPRASHLSLSPLGAVTTRSRAGGAGSHCGASIDVSAAASPSFDSGQSSPASPAVAVAAASAGGGVHALPRSAVLSRSSSRGAAPAPLVPASFADARSGELSVITVGGARSSDALLSPASQPLPVAATLRASPLSAFSSAATPPAQPQSLPTRLALLPGASSGAAEGAAGLALSPPLSVTPAPASARRDCLGAASRRASVASTSALSPTTPAPAATAASPSLQRARRLSQSLVAEPETLPAAAITALRRQRTLDALAAAQAQGSGRSHSSSRAASPAAGATVHLRGDDAAADAGRGGASALRDISPAPAPVPAVASASAPLSPLGRGARRVRGLSLEWGRAAFASASATARDTAEQRRHALGRGRDCEREHELVHPLLALPDVSVFLRQSASSVAGVGVPVPRGFAQAHAEGLGHNRLLPAVAGAAHIRVGAGARARAFSAADVLTTLSIVTTARIDSPARASAQLPSALQAQARSSASPRREEVGMVAAHARSHSGGGFESAGADQRLSSPFAASVAAAVAASPLLPPSGAFASSRRSLGSGSAGTGSGTDEGATLRESGAILHTHGLALPTPQPMPQLLVSASALARQRARPRSIGTDLLRRRSASWLTTSPALAAPASGGAAATSVGSPSATAPTSAASSAAASSDDEAVIAGRSAAGTPRLWRLGSIAAGCSGGGGSVGSKGRGGAARATAVHLESRGPAAPASASPPLLSPRSIAAAALTPLALTLVAALPAQQMPDRGSGSTADGRALDPLARAQAESKAQRSEPATSPFHTMTSQARRHLGSFGGGGELAAAAAAMLAEGGGSGLSRRHVRKQSAGSVSEDGASDHGDAGNRTPTPTHGTLSLSLGASSPLRKVTSVGAASSPAAPAAALETALLSAFSLPTSAPPAAPATALLRGSGVAWPQAQAAVAASSGGAAAASAAARVWPRFVRGRILLAESVVAYASAVAADV
jgi:hypothetical protein